MEQLFTNLSHAVEGAPLLALAAAVVWGILSIVLSPCHLASIPLIVGFISKQGQVTTRRAFLTSTLFAVGILITIAAIGLTKIYGSGNTEVVAMKDVSVTLARGEVVALLGPSGAGKSTFLTAIGLINPPTAGRIVMAGEPVMDGDRALVDLRAYRRQHLGCVFQKANLIPFLNALENVAVAMEINDVSPRAARKRAMELLEYHGVADRANNLPDALSGGQQQRVAVARALANEPSLILADEPTAALDSHRGLVRSGVAGRY